MTRKTTPSNSFRVAHVLQNHADDIVEDYLCRLRDFDSPLLADSEQREGLKSQAKAVLEETAQILCGSEEHPILPENGLSDRIGNFRADREVHPSESLRAVSALTEAALSVVANVLPPSPTSREEIVGTAVAIQKSIMERVARASISYVDYLLRKVHEAYLDERWRIGRELHDEVAHSLAALSQSLETYEVLHVCGDSGGEDEFTKAKNAVRDVLRWVKDLSEELRNTSNAERLEVVLSDLLSSDLPPWVQSWISVKGNESLLPFYVRDEMFLILQEAIHLAATRQNVQEIRVELRITSTAVIVLVADDGECGDGECGDGKCGAGERRFIGAYAGLESMRARALLLRGTVKIDHEPGVETRTEVTLPLARRDYRRGAEVVAVNDPITVLLADGHEHFRKSVAEVLKAGTTNVRVEGEARNDSETVDLARRNNPDVVLLDLEIPLTGAKGLVYRLAEASPTSKVVVLAMYEDTGLADELLVSGASAYVVKGASREQLLSAIRAAKRGEKSIVLSVPRSKPKRLKVPLKERLSARQLEILTLAARGMSNRKIASTLHISEATVKRHLANIYAKLQVSSRNEAAEKALAEGLALQV